MALALLPNAGKASNAKNTLFVRRLSPQVTEAFLRETFHACDTIERVLFRSFPGRVTEYFAQIDFATSRGVTEGHKLSGTPILGVPCEISVMDPTQKEKLRQIWESQQGLPEEEEEDLPKEPQGVQAEYIRSYREKAEDKRLRTVHIAGLHEGVTEEALRLLCGSFGEVLALRLDKDGHGKRFGLVEFKDRMAATATKQQREFLVDGEVLTFTEAKTMVDTCAFAEQSVHFQPAGFDGQTIQQVMAFKANINPKLAKARAAAAEIMNEPLDPQVQAQLAPPAPIVWAGRSEREAKEEDAAKRRRAEEEAAKRRGRGSSDRGRRRRKRRRCGSGSDSSAAVGRKEDDAIDLEEDDIAVIPNTELLVLGESSPSGSEASQSPRRRPPRAPPTVAEAAGDDGVAAVKEGGQTPALAPLAAEEEARRGSEKRAGQSGREQPDKLAQENWAEDEERRPSGRLETGSVPAEHPASGCGSCTPVLDLENSEMPGLAGGSIALDEADMADPDAVLACDENTSRKEGLLKSLQQHFEVLAAQQQAPTPRVGEAHPSTAAQTSTEGGESCVDSADASPAPVTAVLPTVAPAADAVTDATGGAALGAATDALSKVPELPKGTADTKPGRGERKGLVRQATEPRWECPECGEVNRASRTSCNNCSAEAPLGIGLAEVSDTSVGSPSHIESSDDDEAGLLRDGRRQRRRVSARSPARSVPESPARSVAGSGSARSVEDASPAENVSLESGDDVVDIDEREDEEVKWESERVRGEVADARARIFHAA